MPNEDSSELLKNIVAGYEGDLNPTEREAVKKFLEATEEMTSKMSLMSIRNFISVMKEILPVLEEYEEITDGLEVFEEVETIINAVLIAVLGAYLLPLIFTLLGGFLKNMGLTITALVFLVLSQCVLCGFAWVVLSLVVYILQAVLCGKAARARRAGAAA